MPRPSPSTPVTNTSPELHPTPHNDFEHTEDVVDVFNIPEISSSPLPRDTTVIAANDPTVTKLELWSYYLYYNGSHGARSAVDTITLRVFKNLLRSIGFDSNIGPGAPCDGTNPKEKCTLSWGSWATVSHFVNSVDALNEVIIIIITAIGATTDYGAFGRWLLLAITCICWAAQFSSIALTSPASWPEAMAIYMISSIMYSMTEILLDAALPRLARNTATSQRLEEIYQRKKTPETKDEYEEGVNAETLRISNASNIHGNIGSAMTFALGFLTAGLIVGPNVDNYTIVVKNGYWMITGIWWFVFKQHRINPPVAKGESQLLIGYRQVWRAMKDKSIPYTFSYLVTTFLMVSGPDTILTLVLVCQNDVIPEQSGLLGIVRSATSVLGIFCFSYVQRRFNFKTKTMFLVTNFACVIIACWGMTGIWSDSFGFHNIYEFWVYNVIYGLLQAPYYVFAVTIMAELTPPGFDNMFFCLYGLSTHLSSSLGLAINKLPEQDDWAGFGLLFILCLCGSLVMWLLIDVERGERDAIAWANKQRDNGQASLDEKAEETEALLPRGPRKFASSQSQVDEGKAIT